MRKKLIFRIFYALFILGVIEIGLRIAFALPQFSELLTVNDSYTWQRQWVSRHKGESEEIFYSFDRYHPALGWVSEPNLRDVLVFGNSYLSTNDRGLRGKTDYPYDRDPGRLRILILGDSFTFGEEVSDQETYSDYLQTMLPQADVINMGIHGYGHDQMLVYFLEEGVKYQPDIVILGFITSDMERNVLAFRDFAKPRYVMRGDDVVLTNSPVPTPEGVKMWDWIRPRILDAASIVSVGARTKSGARQQEEQEVTRRILANWAEAVKSSGAIPVLAYLPVGEELADPQLQAPGEDFLNSFCATRQDVFCFSTRPHFLENIQRGKALVSPFHWDASGHLAVAEAMFSELQPILNPVD